ncbi:OB-fold domain-containing protein [Sporichthya sp.]|uniref:Zn-ribbon domain-containing OB-fold protein n=1 Tax=Sporichthya sp. TaxID=65475 RepID=UPI0017FC5FBE|nr:OB-fold domain-containing protein [Sporichthya sp.]MBA3743232.1 OB-fold domain-containing protein [Sporichthya sp.]
MSTQIPIVDYLVLGPVPHLRAHQCTHCAALYFDRRNGCARCGRREFGTKDLATTGTVRAFTIVRRASANLKTPYISAIVDLDGGGVVKANLVDIPAEAATITPGLPVELTTWVAGTDDDGTEAVSFGFKRTAAAA